MSDRSLPASPESLPNASDDATARLISQLRDAAPHAFTENKIDFEKLKVALGEHVETGRERYGLGWAGKADAFRNVQTLSKGTLAPMPSESVNWDATENLIIEGDNLEVLKLLQRPYHGKVKMIYIDPPYNTGKDFIYPDNFREGLQDYLRFSGQVDHEGFSQSANKDTNGRYHSNWLNMMYPRLFLARNLLREDGVIFVSIDDHEVHNLRHLMDEVFGEENFVGCLIWKNVTDNNPTNVATEHEYILVFARQKLALEREWKSAVSDVKDALVEVGKNLTSRLVGEDLSRAYHLWFKENKENLWPLDRYKYIDENGVYTGSQSVHNPGREGYRYDVPHPVTGKPCKQPLMGYRFPRSTMQELLKDKCILFGEDETKIIEIKIYASEFQERLASVQEIDGRLGAYELADIFSDIGKVFTNPKPVRLMATFVPFLLKSEDIILDFFAGSGTTAQAVLELNAKDGGHRKFILVQLPEKPDNPKFPTIADITRERVRRVIKRLDDHSTTLSKTPLQESIALDNRAIEKEAVNKPQDLGFRAFKLTASNFKVWDESVGQDEAALSAQIELHADNLIGPLGTSAADGAILYELILRAGLPISAPVTRMSTPHGDAFAVNGSELLICVEAKITQALVRALMATKPVRFVCLDKSFAGDDALKTNTALEAESHGVKFQTA